MNQNRSMKSCELKELWQFCLQVLMRQRILKKILATGRYRDGPPGRNVFLKKLAILVFVLVLNIPVYKGKYMLLTMVPNFQCVLDKECTLPGLISVQRLIKPCSSVYDAAILADLSDLHSWLEPNFSAPMTMQPNRRTCSFCKTVKTCDGISTHRLIPRK